MNFLRSLLTILFLISGNIAAQVDSLINVYRNDVSDTATFDLINTQLRAMIYSAPEEALSYSNQLLEIVDEKDELYKAKAYHIKGISEYMNEKHDDAIESLLRSLNVFEKRKARKLMALNYNSLATVYQVRKEEKTAISYYKESIQLFEQLKDTVWVANISANLGGHFMERDSLIQADYYFDKAIAYHEAKGNDVYLGFTKLNQGSLRVKQKRPKEAVESFNVALKKVPYAVSPLIHAVAYGGLGQAQLELGQSEQAIENLKESYRISSEIKHDEQRQAVSKDLARYYKENGDYKKAFEFQAESFALKDSFLNAETDERLVNALEKYKSEKKQQELELLTALNQNKDLKIQRTRAILIFSFLALFGLLVFAVSIYRNRNEIKGLNDELVEQKGVISKSLDEKELLLKEIHHRVKNNLQVVSSLLSLQSEYVKDDSALSAINDGRNRVKSMALIHQNLYQEDDLTGIRVKEYFSKLIEGLFESYNTSPEKVSLLLDVDDRVMDVDLIVPLGLIANELITNSLKYAFLNQDEGVIKVFLKQDNNSIELVVEDDGQGFDKSIIKEDINSFGYQMILAFVEKLDAEMKIDTTNGAKVTVRTLV